MDIEEEGEARRKLIDRESTLEGSFDIVQPICQRKGEFLHSSSSGLANVIAADADGVPARHKACAKFDSIGYQTHRRFRWEEKLFLRDILFQNIVLQRTTQLC